MKKGDAATIRTKMEQLRLTCNTDLHIQQQSIDAGAISFRKSLDSANTQTQQTLQFQAKLGKLKTELREAEDNLVKALAVKTRKEAKMIEIAELISTTNARVEELRGVVEDKRARKHEYSTLVSQQDDAVLFFYVGVKALEALEEKLNQNTEHREAIEEATVWYNKVLGLRIECGQGVKFIFTNINANNPDDEYSFTVRCENDVHTLIDCDPQLNEAKDLIIELNKSNGLFKFIRTMREKFLEAVAGLTSQDQDTSTVSMPPLMSSISISSRDESSPQKAESQYDEYKRASRKLAHGKRDRSAILSPVSASSLRRSPRFKVKK
ncbi:kinetochore protein SPC25 homolog isoform X2 [Solanum dulcamara]|uniref:kinetochore protein SPC25 homolog isoform X2 n=1 Tax=Solanum dulcamara TaxID=45834 RepID=UPI0024860941|nr:kinetochore protein SPC25 homolog isoform X2 [Solanum dulcamara]